MGFGGKGKAEVPPASSTTVVAQNVSQSQAAQSEERINNTMNNANKLNFLRMQKNGASNGGTFQ